MYCTYQEAIREDMKFVSVFASQDIAAVNDEAELVGVRYYIRLIVEDGAQQAYWHTHEIFFHR